MTETTQTEIPTCPLCGEKIRLRLVNANCKRWRCRLCGYYFIYPSCKVLKKCQICGKEFFGTRNRKFCSYGCALKLYEAKNAKEREERRLKWQNQPKIACLWCREFFTPKNDQHRFDIMPCQHAYHAMTHKINNQYFFDKERTFAELQKLRELGKNYVLPEREVES